MSRSRDAVATSGLYSLLGSVGVKALLFVRSIAVARLIEPNEFGRFVLVATALGFLEAVSQPGLTAAIVQKNRVNQRELETAWTLMVFRGIALTGLFILVAPWIADALGQSDLTGLLRGMGLLFLVKGAASLSIHVRARSVELGPQVRTQLIGALVATVVAILASALLRTAWGMVIGLLAGAVVEAVGTYFVRGFRPRFRFARGELHGFLHFGRWYFATVFLEYLSTAGDDLVIGRRLGTAPLGSYGMAYRIGNTPTTEVSHVIGRVAFPALSRVDDHERRIDAYRRSLVVVVGLAAPMAALLVVLAQPLILSLLGTEWRSAVTPLAIMAVAGFLRAVFATGGPLFAAVGRPDLGTWMLVCRTALLFLGLALLLGRYGISGAAWASLISVVGMGPFWLHGLHRIRHAPRTMALTVIGRLPGAVATGILAFAGSLVVDSNAWSVVFGLVAGSTAYVVWVAFADRALRTGIREIVTRAGGAP